MRYILSLQRTSTLDQRELGRAGHETSNLSRFFCSRVSWFACPGNPL